MRSLNEGKTRLSNLLSPNKREKLIKLLFTQLLKKLKTLKDQCPLIYSDILVITPCEEVEKISKDFHVCILANILGCLKVGPRELQSLPKL